MSENFKKEDALVLTSGGMDSTTCLFWAKENFNKIYAISFNYGQKHIKELESASTLCSKLKIEHKIIDLSFLKNLVISNLFEGEKNVNTGHKLNKDVPASFVPYRNVIFLTLASAWASTLGVRHIIIGVCETDYSGYADCRDIFIKSMQVSLNLATDFKDRNVIIHTPLMFLTKAEEFFLAEELNCLDVLINETITCYNASDVKNDFGIGCGKCPACKLRKDGYKKFLRSRNEKQSLREKNKSNK